MRIGAGLSRLSTLRRFATARRRTYLTKDGLFGACFLQQNTDFFQQLMLCHSILLDEAFGAEPMDAGLTPVVLGAGGYGVKVTGALPLAYASTDVVYLSRGAKVTHPAADDAAQTSYG
jgi:hypothetical protein